jgi:hypothetical protein
MNQAISKLVNDLKKLNPNERLKYIRKKILQINQDEFCFDGIIRISTLKAIESGICKISEKMSSKLLNKLLISGVICNEEIFHENPSIISLKINKNIKNTEISSDVSFFTKRLTKLVPIKIENDEFGPIIPKNSLIFINPVDLVYYDSLKNTLCIIEGADEKKEIYFLTYKNNKINAVFNKKNAIFSIKALGICKTNVVEVIFYANK